MVNIKKTLKAFGHDWLSAKSMADVRSQTGYINWLKSEMEGKSEWEKKRIRKMIKRREEKRETAQKQVDYHEKIYKKLKKVM